jgi:hypothetical protein
MAGRGITIRVLRTDAIRMLGDHMRKKTQEFERQKRQMPKVLEAARTRAIKCTELRMKQILQATKVERLSELLGEDLMAYKNRNQLGYTPELNLCKEKQLLLMLQNDVRKVIPINSNHELWGILQGKCEPVEA